MNDERDAGVFVNITSGSDIETEFHVLVVIQTIPFQLFPINEAPYVFRNRFILAPFIKYPIPILVYCVFAFNQIVQILNGGTSCFLQPYGNPFLVIVQ